MRIISLFSRFLSNSCAHLIRLLMHLLRSVIGKRWAQQQQIRNDAPSQMASFRPFQLTEITFADDHQLGPTDLPQPRSGHRIACTKNGIYTFGGFNPELGEENMFGELWKFDYREYKWELLLDRSYSQMPTELASMAVWSSGTAFLIYGGSGFPFGNHNSNKLHICETAGADGAPPQIREIETSGHKPPALYGQSMVIHDQYLYVIGGTSGYEYSSDVYRLDLKTRTWSLVCATRPDMNELDPEGRYRHELAVDDRYIYMIGGGTVQNTFDLATIPAYDLEGQKWTRLETKPDPTALQRPANKGFPKPRKFHTLVQVDDQIVVTGGCNDEENLRDIWRLDLRSLQWTLLHRTRLPYKLFFHDATCTPEGCMFIFAGVREQNGLTRTNNLYKIWIKVPTLAAMCAEVIRQLMRADESSRRWDIRGLCAENRHVLNQLL